MRLVSFHASRLRSVARLLTWGRVLAGASLGVVWDQVRGRNSRRQRAARFARAVERMGGPFVQIGHRLALDADLRQSPYGEAVARLRDDTPPFPVGVAVAAIERTTGRPLYETFAGLDPDPIRSTSAFCTYQARLLNGDRVIAKVRRPGAGEALVADLRLVDWVAASLEYVTVFRRGATREIRRDLREALLDEFDFVREARHQEAFRRAAGKSGKKFFTAPLVHFDLSGDEVIVQDFASGMWLWELISAVEHDHAGVLTLAAELGIDPKRVARRLLWLSFWSWHENLFFLADPNPHEIILGEGGRLSFIDFTSTGAIDHSMKRALQQNMYHAVNRDPLNMARATLKLLEPLRPVDLIGLTKALETANLQMLYAFETKPAGRRKPQGSSLTQWRGLLDSAERYGITVNYGVVRLIRAAVLHEQLALRLDPNVNVLKEYRRFLRDRADRSADPSGRLARRRSRELFNKKIYLQLEHLAKAGEGFVFRLRHMLTLPRVNFSAMVSKSSFAFLTLVKFLTQAAQLTVAAAVIVVVGHGLGPESLTLREVFESIWNSSLYWGAVIVLVAVNGRALLFRLDDKAV